MIEYLKAPDLVVYLKANVNTLMKQIKSRGREFEKGIERSYLERLNRSYGHWIGSYKLGKVLIIDSNKLDFVYNNDHFDFILSKIKNALS